MMTKATGLIYSPYNGGEGWLCWYHCMNVISTTILSSALYYYNNDFFRLSAFRKENSSYNRLPVSLGCEAICHTHSVYSSPLAHTHTVVSLIKKTCSDLVNMPLPTDKSALAYITVTMVKYISNLKPLPVHVSFCGTTEVYKVGI